jgi:predicted dinucleotide-binding enzyme
VAISDRTVAIIGTGNIGGILAAEFAAGGQDFLLAGRDRGRPPARTTTQITEIR